MNIEDRLRGAIDARTAAVDPSLDRGLDRIDEKLTTPGAPERPPSRTWILGAAAAVVVVAAVFAGLVLRDDGDGGNVDTGNRPGTTATTDATGSPSTTRPPTTTQGPEPTATTEQPPPEQPPPEQPSSAEADVLAQAVWPRPSSDVRFDDPVAAARSFALYLGRFADPVVGEFEAGDSRSGEVPVRPSATAPETTVLVRQLSDDHWYVIGSATADITVAEPAAGATLGDPQALSGTALAFEGNVQVQLLGYRPDGRSEQLGLTNVTGSGLPPAGPFSGELDWSPGSAELEPYGVLMFWTSDESGEVGGSLQVVAFPVRLVG